MSCESTAYTNSGSKVYVSLVNPSTYDQTGFEALTWLEVKPVSNIGDFGGESNLVTFDPVGTGVVNKHKGSVNYGAMTLDCARDPDDVGQAALLTAGANSYKSDIAFKIAHNDTPSGGSTPTTQYFQAKVMNEKPTSMGGVNDIVSATYNVEVNCEIIEVAAA